MAKDFEELRISSGAIFDAFKREAMELVHGGENFSAAARTLGYTSPMAFEQRWLAGKITFTHNQNVNRGVERWLGQ